MYQKKKSELVAMYVAIAIIILLKMRVKHIVTKSISYLLHWVVVFTDDLTTSS